MSCFHIALVSILWPPFPRSGPIMHRAYEEAGLHESQVPHDSSQVGLEAQITAVSWQLSRE